MREVKITCFVLANTWGPNAIEYTYSVAGGTSFAHKVLHSSLVIISRISS